MNSRNLLAGLGGAIVLTLLNESLKNLNHKMPRIDLVGEQALQKTSEFLGAGIINKDTLYKSTLAGDIVSNATYFSLIGAGKRNLWKSAASAGFLAGLAAISLPKRIGLDDSPVANSAITKSLTVGYYMAGAFATAGILNLMQKK